MKIAAPQLETDGEHLVYSAEIAFDRGEEHTLWFSVPTAYAGWVSERADAALIACLMPAMRSGEDITVEGPVTDELLYQLRTDFQVLIRKQKRRLKPVQIHAADPRPATAPEATGVITGFSAGVDSWQVLAQHYYASDVPESLKVTHLLYNDVGSHGRGGSELYQRRLENITALAGHVGLPVIPVVSNIEQLYLKERYVGTHTVRNASVPWLLQLGTRHFYYASAFDYTGVRIAPSRAMAEADIAYLPLLSSSALTLRSVGSALTRVQKTLALTEIPATYQGLDVCISPDEDSINCSRCWKCRRTMLTLDIAGKLEPYAEMFDLDLWARTRRRAWQETLQKAPSSKLEREVIHFARRRGYDLAQEAEAAQESGAAEAAQAG